MTVSRNRKSNRRLNDDLRQYLLGGGTQISPKIAAFPLPKLRRLVERLARYDDFPRAVDPSGEHALGTFAFEGATVVFEIVVKPIQARTRPSFSEPDRDERVMTIMLEDESVLLNGKAARAGFHPIRRRKTP